MNIRTICLDKQIRFFSKQPANCFLLQGLSQPFCKCRATFNNIILGIVSYIRNYKDRKNEKVQKFSIFPANQTFCSPKLLAAFRPLEYQSKLFYSWKITCQKMHSFPCNGNLMGQTSQKLNIGLIRLDIKTRFPSKQLSGLLPSR